MPTDTVPVAPATLSLDLSDESATSALYRAALGPVGVDHYLPVFVRFDLADRAGSGWNWAACLCTLGWMIFRRMWGAALVYAGVLVAVGLTGGALLVLVFQAPAYLLWGIGLAALLAAFVVPGVWGDAWLYAHCRQRMARALADSSSWADAVVRLDRQALTRPRAWAVALAQLALLGAGVAVLGMRPDGLLVQSVRAPALDVPLATGRPTSASVAVAVAASASAASASSASASASAPASTSTSTSTSTSASASSAARQLASSAPASASAQSAVPQGPAAAPAPVVLASAPMSSSGDAAAVPDEALAGRYVVNVGLFAVESNASSVQARLRAAGVKVMLQELQTANGRRTRVRAGPYQSRAQAEAAADTIRALELEAVVVLRQQVRPPR